jgi:hypothetical protein
MNESMTARQRSCVRLSQGKIAHAEKLIHDHSIDMVWCGRRGVVFCEMEEDATR